MNHFHCIFGQLGIPIACTTWPQSMCVLVRIILLRSDVFQITQSVVRLLTIFMIHLPTLWTRTNKCGHYKSMNITLVMAVIKSSQANNGITCGRYTHLVDVPHLPAGTTANCLYSAMIRHSVQALESHDRKPTFFHDRPYEAAIRRSIRALTRRGLWQVGHGNSASGPLPFCGMFLAPRTR